ncbi:MAG TPA: bacillithiol biosynthesis cysteine-adding enzyme BshC [Bryobacteraceae bacterium]|nr:bacillithiol biosynthesis cysteine-adding enzyme BshC [Bryobacteraceae bacterium]
MTVPTEPACIRHTDIPGTTRLFADFTYHFERVARFYRHNPHDPESIPAAARELNYPDERRRAIVAALAAQNGPSESLDLLAKPGTVAVVTGQQVGLFSGPAYTIYKAITAAHCARDLATRGIRAVPVFWLATEDHDFEEVNHVWSFDGSYQPFALHVDIRAENRGRQRPVGGIILDHPPVDELAGALAAFPHAEELIAILREAYPPGITMGAGFRALLKKLLAKLNLLYLDPLDPAVRKIASPIVAEALAASAELKAQLLARNRELEASGYHAQVHLEPKTSLFFLLQNGERVPLRRNDSEFADYRDRAAEVSPNALLRPVVQDYLLPTVAYIGGPAELAYFAQAQVIYERLLGRMPVVASRMGFTLLESRVEKLLARYKMTLPQIFVDEEQLQARIARTLVPESVERSFADASSDVEKHLNRLRSELEHFDPTLARSLQTARAKILWQFEKTRRKIERESMRRDARAMDHARYLSGLLFPHRHLQERFYSILPFLAKHGLDLIDQLDAAARLDCPDHRLVTI